MLPQPPDPSAEDALIPLSALQHYLFCQRQCALIHIEQVWAEDGATAEGRIMHDRVDKGPPDRRAGLRTVRGMTLRSLTLGVTGKADAVEFHGAGAEATPYPVEYKRGRPKAHRADEVQLCAQAMSLEEMFGVGVPEGALFYGETRRRFVVDFDAELRALTTGVAVAVHAMMMEGRSPPPSYGPACKRCSLQDLCAPRALEKPPKVLSWLTRQLSASMDKE